MTKLFYILSCIKQDVYTFLFYFLRLSCSHSSHSLCHPSLRLTQGKSSTLPLRKMPDFRPLLYPASSLAYSPFGKKLNSSPQEDARFWRRCTLAYKFHFILRHHFLGLSNSLLTLRLRAHPFLSRKIMFLRAYCCVMFPLSCLGSLSFGTRPYY